MSIQPQYLPCTSQNANYFHLVIRPQAHQGGLPDAIPEPVVRTILFTDIVGSTKKAAAIGDRKWLQLLAQHDNLITRAARDYSCKHISSTGDGFKITFGDACRSVSCAVEIHERITKIGLSIRLGAHTGECYEYPNDTKGLSVHISAKTMQLCKQGGIVLTDATRELLFGSDIEFRHLGATDFDGVPKSWKIYTVDSLRLANQVDRSLLSADYPFNLDTQVRTAPFAVAGPDTRKLPHRVHARSCK